MVDAFAYDEGSGPVWLSINTPITEEQMDAERDHYGKRLQGVRWDRHGITPASLPHDVQELALWSDKITPGAWHAVYSQHDLLVEWGAMLRKLAAGEMAQSAPLARDFSAKLRALYRCLVDMQTEKQAEVIRATCQVVQDIALDFVLSPTNLTEISPTVNPFVDGCMDQVEGPTREAWIPSRASQAWLRSHAQLPAVGLGFIPEPHDMALLMSCCPDMEILFLPGRNDEVIAAMDAVATQEASLELESLHNQYKEENHP